MVVEWLISILLKKNSPSVGLLGYWSTSCFHRFYFRQNLTNFVMESKEWWWLSECHAWTTSLFGNLWLILWWSPRNDGGRTIDGYHIDEEFTKCWIACLLITIMLPSFSFQTSLCHNLRWNPTDDGGRVIDQYHIKEEFTKCWIGWLPINQWWQVWSLLQKVPQRDQKGDQFCLKEGLKRDQEFEKEGPFWLFLISVIEWCNLVLRASHAWLIAPCAFCILLYIATLLKST